MAIYTNITTSPATTTLIAKNSSTGGGIKKITIANFSDNAADATVNVFLNDGTATDLYLCKNVAIPKGATLVLDDNVSFDVKKYDLKMYSTGTAPALTVIIK
jgi:hypothetical protein